MMKTLIVACAAALGLTVASTPSIAQSHGGGGHGGSAGMGMRGGGGWSGGGGSHGGGGGSWNGGNHWHGGYYGGHYYRGYYPYGFGYGFGLGLALGAPFYPYYWGYPYYGGYAPGYSYAYSTPTYISPSVTYVEQGASGGYQSQGDNYWYYCPDQGYYPYVQNCSRSWLKVLPNTTPPGQ